MVSGADGGTTKLQAFGTYDGDLFCCTNSTSEIDHVQVVGTDDGDTIKLYYNGGAGEFWLQYTPSSGGWGSDIVNGAVQGNGGNDVIWGSRETDSSYTDSLDGGEDADTIYGQDGTNYINGEAGEDFLFGGPNVDWIYGGANGDIIVGAAGDDHLFGEGGVDRIQGGDGDDYIDGGDGGDTLCGGADSNEIYDGDSDSETNPDVLWGPTGDLYECDSANTLMTSGATQSGGSGTCTDSISSPPSLCP